MEICFKSGNDKDPGHLLNNILFNQTSSRPAGFISKNKKYEFISLKNFKSLFTSV